MREMCGVYGSALCVPVLLGWGCKNGRDRGCDIVVPGTVEGVVTCSICDGERAKIMAMYLRGAQSHKYACVPVALAIRPCREARA